MSLLIPDASKDKRFKDQESVIEQNLLSVMSVPIRTGERVLGVIYVDSLIRKGQVCPVPGGSLIEQFSSLAA